MRGRTIGEDLRVSAAAEPEKPAVIAPEGELSYADLDRAADRLAAGLAHNGVQRGDRVATLLPNSLEAVIAIYGIFRAGAAISPLNPTVKARKLAYVLDDSGARALICDDERVETAREAAERAAGDVHVFSSVESVPTGEAGLHRPLSVDLAGVVYTSGSTGEPKGVAVTHQTMTFVADSIIEYLEMDQSERVLCVLPLSFGYGLYQLLTCVRSGGDPGARARVRVRRPGRLAARGSADHRASRGADGVRGPALTARARGARVPRAAHADQRRRPDARADDPVAALDLPQRALLLDVRTDRVRSGSATCRPTSSSSARPRSGSRSRAPRPGSRTRTATSRSPARSAS